MKWEIDWGGMSLIPETDGDQEILIRLSNRLPEQTDKFYDEGKMFIYRDHDDKIFELDFHR